MSLMANIALSDPLLISEIIKAFYKVNWTYQRLVFGRVHGGRINQLSCKPGHPSWETTLGGAKYICPSTFHLFLERGKWEYAKAYTQELDNIPFIFMDIDYHGNTKKSPPIDIISAFVDLNLPPTLMIHTPHGYHVWWALEKPIVLRWEQAPGTGAWRPNRQGMKTLSWWRNNSYALCTALNDYGIPADSVSAGQPARLMRIPTSENLVTFDPEYTYSLQDLTDSTEEWQGLRRRYKFGNLELTSFLGDLQNWPGAEKGNRNQTCWKLCIAVLDGANGDKVLSWRIVQEWARRCVPAYPEREAGNTFRSIASNFDRKRFYVRKAPQGLTREQAIAKARAIRTIRKDKLISQAISEMIEEGYPEPNRFITEIARRATKIAQRTEKKKRVKRDTVYRYLKDMGKIKYS